MEISLQPGFRRGCVEAPPSKSHAHRLLICAALGREPVYIPCSVLCEDIAATVQSLRGLGADITETPSGEMWVTPGSTPESAVLPCGESGSTLRFLLPVCGALGVNGQFTMAGRLPERPLHPLDSVLTEHGMALTRKDGSIQVRGRLQGGVYRLPGNVSSQFITGLLFALPLLDEDSTLIVEGSVESAGYIRMTEQVLRQSGISFDCVNQTYQIPGRQEYALPSGTPVEGDWSGAAFFLAMGAFSPGGIQVSGLCSQTMQGDSAIVDLLRRFGANVTESVDSISVRRGSLRGCEIDAAMIPDLVPALSVLAAGAVGETQIHHAARLRLKESDRLEALGAMLRSLGGSVTVRSDGLVIQGSGMLGGGTVDCFGDHRIAMAAAAAACICTEPVTVTQSECVKKSFPRFWECFQRLEVTL